MSVPQTLIDCSLIKSVDTTSKGHMRLQTAFLYPDGSSLLTSVEPVLVTDFGTTLSWLSNLQIRPNKSRRRNALFLEILQTYGVANLGGSLELVAQPSELTLAIIRLGQTCLRTADLFYTSRFAAPSRFNEELEEMLVDMELEYTPDDQIIGRLGNVVKVDFRIRGRKQDTAVLTLASDKYATAARQRAEHVFTAFSDLLEWPGQRVAALDDRVKTYADIDLERVATVAAVVHVFDDREALRETLIAA
jgi:hypothetical protein